MKVILLTSALLFPLSMYTQVCPVQFKEVSVNVANKVATVTWTTGEEINNNYFELETSADNYVYFPRKKISPANSHSYAVRDTIYNSTYYRIKQVDNDGRFSLSKTTYVSIIDGKTNVYIRNKELVINMFLTSAATYNLTLFNLNGQPLSTSKYYLNKGSNFLSYPLPSPSAIYIIKIIGPEISNSFKIYK